MKFSFTVYGKAEPKGSVRAILPKGKQWPILISDNKETLKPWAQQVARTAQDAYARANQGDITPIARTVAVRVDMVFYLQKPMSAKKTELWPTKRPDRDKLARAIQDALKGAVYEDDGQVVGGDVWKLYGNPPRVELEVETLEHWDQRDINTLAVLTVHVEPKPEPEFTLTGAK